MSEANKHTLFEDLQAIFTGAIAVALGVLFLKQAGLLTGGTTGLAILIHYSTGLNFGLTLFCVNLPFYILAVKRMGWRFTLKTLFAVFLVSIMAEFIPIWLKIDAIDPIFAAVGGGLLVGMGLLIVFRHKASMGGFNVLALYIQDRYGIPVGKTQMALDVSIVVAGLWLIPPWLLLVSVTGAVVLNFVLTVNHKPGRYTGF
ncbi:MAG: YitT family protein [Oceanospirillaceae bacterium]|nr:YitT family protein [Oceanospirillaceae bacterium]